MEKYYSDLERYEHVRKFRISGKTIRQYARENEIRERTLGDRIMLYALFCLSKKINQKLSFYS